MSIPVKKMIILIRMLFSLSFNIFQIIMKPQLLKTAILLSGFIILTHMVTKKFLQESVSLKEIQLSLKCESLQNAVRSQILDLSKRNCICIRGYQWSQQKAQCIKKYKNNKSLANYINPENIQKKLQNIKQPASHNLLQQDNYLLNDTSNNSLTISQRRLSSLACNFAQGFILYRNVCINCRSIKYTLGPGAKDVKTCYCQNNFVWSPQYYLCSCLNYDGLYTTLYQDSCYPCDSLLDNAVLSLQCNQADPTIFPFDTNYQYYCNSLQNTLSGDGNQGCACNYGYTWNATFVECICSLGISYYYNGQCVLCNSLSSSLSSSCVACTGQFYNNGVYCVDSSSIYNYNPTTSSCLAGSIIQKDPYYGINVKCVCILGSYYLNVTTCIACSNSAPGGSVACTTCSAANGYFATSAGCIYCPNLLGSTAKADPNGNGCVCQPGYYWNVATSTCDCDLWSNYVGGPIANCIYCPSIIGTTQTANTRGCGCLSGFWQPAYQRCQTVCSLKTNIIVNTLCYSCFLVANSLGPNANNTACKCISPFVWYWNTRSLQGLCICNSTTSVSSKGGCADCRFLNYSTGVVFSKTCVCDTNFYWDTISIGCKCPSTWTLDTIAKTCYCNTTTSVLINNICVNCMIIAYNNGLDANNTICFCLVPYQWLWNPSTITGSCFCNPKFAITTNIGVECLNCSTLSYVTGAVTNNTCICRNNFLWNSTSYTCYCPSSFSLIDNACVCNTTTSAIIDKTCINCLMIIDSFGPNADNTICLCIVPYWWVWNSIGIEGSCNCNSTFSITTTSGVGCLNCSALSYSTGSVVDNTCICLPNFVWNTTSLTCFCPPSFTLKNGACSCDTSNSVIIEGICVKCYLIANNYGPNANNTACRCSPSSFWIWNQTNKIGTCVCNTMSFKQPNGVCVFCSNGVAPNGLQCRCSSLTIWNDNLLKCICILGESYFDGVQCILCSNLDANLQSNCIACFSPYFNNGVYCMPSTYISFYNISSSSCSTGSTIQKDPHDIIDVRCVCTKGTYFQNNTMCLSCINSAQYSYCTNCAYQNGYFASTNGCIYCPNLLGSTNLSNQNGCICQKNYYWNSVTNTCDCNYKNNYVGGPIANCIYCLNVSGTTSSATIDGCGCINGIWNIITLSCINGCNTSNGLYTSSGQCIYCATINYAIGATNGSQCICNANFIWDSANQSCLCPSPYVLYINSVSSTCEQYIPPKISEQSSSSGIVLIAAIIVCLVLTVITIILLIKYCKNRIFNKKISILRQNYYLKADKLEDDASDTSQYNEAFQQFFKFILQVQKQQNVLVFERADKQYQMIIKQASFKKHLTFAYQVTLSGCEGNDGDKEWMAEGDFLFIEKKNVFWMGKMYRDKVNNGQNGEEMIVFESTQLDSVCLGKIFMEGTQNYKDSTLGKWRITSKASYSQQIKMFSAKNLLSFQQINNLALMY